MRKKNSQLSGVSLAISVDKIERRIFLIRGHKVMIDSDLAALYRVTTGNLNLAVRRNRNRFPEDFMFQLTREETNLLLLQIARAKGGSGGPAYDDESLSLEYLALSEGRGMDRKANAVGEVALKSDDS